MINLKNMSLEFLNNQLQVLVLSYKSSKRSGYGPNREFYADAINDIFEAANEQGFDLPFADSEFLTIAEIKLNQ